LKVTANGTFDVSGPVSATHVTSYSYTFPADSMAGLTFTSNPWKTLTFVVQCGPFASTGSGGTGGNSVTFLNFTDGRMNSHDGAETAAVYCESDGGVTVYAVVKSVGTLAFKVTKAELDAVPAKPEHNTLIKAGLGMSLYRLTTGELQINAPDNYVFTWDGCTAS
jgi:hypothetical protein